MGLVKRGDAHVLRFALRPRQLSPDTSDGNRYRFEKTNGSMRASYDFFFDCPFAISECVNQCVSMGFSSKVQNQYFIKYLLYNLF